MDGFRRHGHRSSIMVIRPSWKASRNAGANCASHFDKHTAKVFIIQHNQTISLAMVDDNNGPQCCAIVHNGFIDKPVHASDWAWCISQSGMLAGGGSAHGTSPPTKLRMFYGSPRYQSSLLHPLPIIPWWFSWVPTNHELWGIQTKKPSTNPSLRSWGTFPRKAEPNKRGTKQKKTWLPGGSVGAGSPWSTAAPSPGGPQGGPIIVQILQRQNLSVVPWTSQPEHGNSGEWCLVIGWHWRFMWFDMVNNG